MMRRFLLRTALISASIMAVAAIAAVPVVWFVQDELATRATVNGITPEEEFRMEYQANLRDACAHGVQIACQ